MERTIIASLAVAFVAGCASPAEGEGTYALGEAVGVASEPLSTEGYEATWQTGQGPVVIATSEQFCFLTSVSGDLDGSTYVEIYNSGWPVNLQFLTGGGAGWAQAKARCIYRPFTNKVEVTVQPSPSQVGTTSSIDPATVCGLTRVGGRFASQADWLSLQGNAGGAWWLSANRGSSTTVWNQGPTGKASCLRDDIGLTGGIYSWDWSQSGWQQRINLGAEIQSTEIERTCMLSAVGGNLRGGGEAVTVELDNGQWYLTGSSLQTGVNGSAKCFDAP